MADAGVLDICRRLLRTSEKPSWLFDAGSLVELNSAARAAFGEHSAMFLSVSVLPVLSSGTPATFRVPGADGGEVEAVFFSWSSESGVQLLQADLAAQLTWPEKQAQLLESVERQVLEAAASSSPIVGALDAVCRMVEGTAGVGAEAIVLSVDVQDAGQSVVLSCPSHPDWVGQTIAVPAPSARLSLPAGGGQVHSRQLFTPDGQLVGFFALRFDDLAQRRLDDANFSIGAKLAAVALTRDSYLRRLRLKHARLEAIGRSLPQGVYQIDASGNWVFCNAQLTAITGVPPAACQGEGWLEWVHEEDRERVRGAWLEAQQSHRDFQAEYRLNGRHAVWILAQETRTEDGGRLGTIADVSEVKSAVLAAARNNERFATLADNIAQLCWMGDASGDRYWFNRRWFEFTGTTLEQVRGQGWTSVHHPQHIHRVLEKVRTSLESGEPWEDTYPLRGANGKYRWFLSRVVPIRDQQGAVHSWFGTNTDITELLELERQLIRQNSALKRSNEDLSRFAFLASHDLQEPLRMVASFAQLALRTPDASSNERLRGYLGRIVESSGRMGKLIRDYLSYAQASTDERPPAERVSVQGILEDVLETMRQPLESAGARVSWRAPLPEAFADPAHVNQVFENLISNAIKYRRESVPLTIDIRACHEGEFCRVEVTDNGQGFSMEESERIFGFLTRLHGRAISGSGIGLATCKALVERNGGAIGATGVPDVGATFWFTLPAAEPVLAAAGSRP